MIYKALKYIYGIYWFIRTVVYTLIVRVMSNQVGFGLRVRGFSKVTNKTYIGNNVHLNGVCVYGSGKLIIGNNFHSGKELLIYTSTHNYKDGAAIPYDSTFIDEDVVIEDNVWIGVRVIVLPGVKIGEGAVIGAGSVVFSDVEKLQVVAGNPVRNIGQRNSEKYFNLKNKKKFY